MTYHHSRARVGSDDFVLPSAGNCSLAGTVPEAHGIDTVLVSNPGVEFNQLSQVVAAGMYIAASLEGRRTGKGEAVALRPPYYQNGATHRSSCLWQTGPLLGDPLGLCC